MREYATNRRIKQSECFIDSDGDRIEVSAYAGIFVLSAGNKKITLERIYSACGKISEGVFYRLRVGGDG